MRFVGFALSMAAVPYLFTTGGLPSLTSTSPLWFGAECAIADGFLVWPKNVWTEQAKPLDGDLECGGQRFTLHDGRRAVDGTTRDLLTWLATRDVARLVSTPVAATMTATALTFTVGDGVTLGSFPRVVWVEREAILCDSIAVNVVTVNASGRGYLGTRAVAHTIDDSQVLFPEAFVDVPWTARRKCVLWGVDGDGVASALWVGYAVRAPALADDGAKFDLSCDSAWAIAKQCPIAGALRSTRTVGISDGRPRTSNSSPAVLKTAWHIIPSAITTNVFSNGSYRSLEALQRAHAVKVGVATLAAGHRFDPYFAHTTGGFTVNAETIATPFGARVSFLTTEGTFTISTTRAASREAVSLDVPDATTSALMLFTTAHSVVDVPLVSLAPLPSSWATETWGAPDGDLYPTTRVPGLRLAVDEDWNAMFTGVSVADGGDIGARFSAAMEFRPRKPGLILAGDTHLMKGPQSLQVVYRVRAQHWANGIRRAVLDLCEDVDPDTDWDWSGVDELVTATTAGGASARDWTFDGKRSLGDLVKETCLLNGCSPIVRDGLLMLHPWTLPPAGVASDVTLTSADLIGKPTWSRWSEGLANRLQVKSAELNLDVSLAQSRARYGLGRVVSLELAGLDDQASLVGDPMEFASNLAGRLQLWGDPLAAVAFTAAYNPLLRLGARVTLSAWMLPSGLGARDLAGAVGLITERTVDLEHATIKCTALVFGRESFAYAPCALVSSVVALTGGTVVQLATAYVDGTGTYSGDIDAGTFAAGDAVELVVRDSFTLTTENLTVLSVNTGANRITFAGAISAPTQALIAAAGSRVDLRFRHFAAVQASQKTRWMFVGDDTTRVIDGTAEPARAIAP